MASNSKPDNIPWLFKKPLTEKESQEVADRILFEDLPLDNLEVTDIEDEEEDDDLDEITSDHQITANTSQPIFYTDETEIVQLENTASESGITAPADNIDGTNSDTNIERKCHDAANSQYGNDTETDENIAASTSETQSMRKKKSDQQDERLNKKMKTKMTRRSNNSKRSIKFASNGSHKCFCKEMEKTDTRRGNWMLFNASRSKRGRVSKLSHSN
ncbi:hypothetical protein JTB14_017229 [Gonioctena quinquepunctata]|nr:hypothetical protein JTB14_017229 [Gonioctena quinquepunctata]